MTTYMIRAIFSPQQRDDLRPEVLPFIGQEAIFRYAGQGTADEDFPGQRRWWAPDGWGWPYWIPEEDLQVQEELPWQPS